MFVNRLTLVVIFRIAEPVGTCDRLGRFVGLESQISGLMLARHLFVAHSSVSEHQVVVGLQIFRIDRKYTLQRSNCVRIFSLQKQHSAKIVDSNSVSRILGDDFAQFIRRAVIVAVIAKDLRIEEMGACEIGIQGDRFRQRPREPVPCRLPAPQRVQC